MLSFHSVPFTPSRAGITLQAVNNTCIATFRNCFLTLNLGLHRTFHWVFIVADIKHAILGADFLCHFNLLVDVCQCHLVDNTTQLQVSGICTQKLSPSLSVHCPPGIRPRAGT